MIETEVGCTGPVRFKLRLFVAGTSPRSQRTIANLHRIGARYFPDRMDLEVVDIYQQPEKAEQDQVVAAPMLVKLWPLPLRRIIGDLSDDPSVLRGLQLESLSRQDNDH